MFNKYLLVVNNLNVIPILLSILFFLIFSFQTINRHLNFNSHAFDLGIYTQVIYLYSQGQLAYSSLKHMILLADHFGPILILFAPIYKLFPSAITLLIIQALFVSLSSIPIYLIARDRLKSTLLSLLITLGFLTSVGITSAIIFDFHLATISVLPLSLILYCWCFKKWRAYFIFLVLSVLFKEDVPLLLLGLGIFELFQKQIRVGSLTMIFSLISFYLIKVNLMEFLWHGGASAYISISIFPLDSPVDLFLLFLTRPMLFLDQIFNSPIKIDTLNALLRQFGYLPVLSPLAWITAFPHLYFRFTSNYWQSWSTLYHHNASLIPFLTVSTVLAIEKFKISKRAVILLLLFSIFTNGLSPNSYIWSTFSLNLQSSNRYSYLNHALANIPPNTPVSAQSPIVPHLANREKIYLFPEIYDAEYIVLDTSLSTYPMGNDELNQKIQILKESPFWKIIKKDKSLIIFKRIT